MERLRWNQSIFEKIIKIDPKILLEFGDPSLLDIDKRKKLLVGFASFYKERDYTGFRLELIQLKRLADQNLQPVIYELLKCYKGHTDIRQLLLRIIWQGSIMGCGEIALGFILNEKIDSFTRACAIRAIGAGGTDDEKTNLARLIVNNTAMRDRSVLEAAIQVFFPNIISIDNLLTILENVDKPTLRSVDYLSYQLDRIPAQIDEKECLELLQGIANLLSRPPYKDENYARFSSKYSWLLGLSIKLVERVASINTFNNSILCILSYIHYGHDLQVDYPNYRVKQDFSRIISENKKLKYELFWYEIEQKRKISNDPITYLSYPESNTLSVGDMEYFLEAIQKRESLDDKLISLNALIQFYYSSDCNTENFEKIQYVIKRNSKLEEHLKNSIINNNNIQKQIKSNEKYRVNENIQQNKYLEARFESIKLLKADPKRINNYTGAKEGLILNDVVFLYRELQILEKDHNNLSLTKWELLELEFGHELAIAFRDYCIKFWRLYRPKLRSQVDNPNSIPLAISIGLSGLTMDAQMNKDWAKNLTKSDVESAIYYALWEFGKLPNWIELLLLEHDDTTRKILINEMKWELSWSSKQPLPYSVISRLRWGENNFSDALNEDIMSLLEKLETIQNINSLAEILTILIQDKKPWTERFLVLIKKSYKAATLDSYNSLWLAAWLCIEADSAIEELENWLNKYENIDNGEARISSVLNYILGDRSLNRAYERNSFMRPNALSLIIKMTFKYISPKNDLVHDGVYHPNARDYAERVRGQLIDILSNIPGQSTYEVLKELSSFFETINLKLQSDHILIRAEQRAEYDRAAELSAWIEKDVVDFAHEAEIFPKSEEDLFNFALSRLDNLKFDIEEGDESNAGILQKIETELELRRHFAKELKNIAKGKYTIGSEEELADQKRTDIRFNYPNISSVPVELKIAENWTVTKLLERLQNQLIGDYMRNSKYGVFLLVRRGRLPVKENWKEGQNNLNFKQLIEWLEHQANTLLCNNSNIRNLKIIGIDLSKRGCKN